MRSFPYPVRVAAGLAATAAEQAKQLPSHVLGLPLTVTSQLLQLSMRLQQQVTELAIKGDEALAALRDTEDEPEWATFDEDFGPPPAPEPDSAGIAAETDYDQLTIPQLRGKLRGFSEQELAELLAHERSHRNRPEFERMLSRRITRLRSTRG